MKVLIIGAILGTTMLMSCESRSGQRKAAIDNQEVATNSSLVKAKLECITITHEGAIHFGDMVIRYVDPMFVPGEVIKIAGIKYKILAMEINQTGHPVYEMPEEISLVSDNIDNPTELEAYQSGDTIYFRFKPRVLPALVN